VRASRRDFVKLLTSSGIALSVSRLALAEEPDFAARETLPGRQNFNPAAAGAGLLAITLAGSAQPAVVAMLLMAVALAFGMTMPNIMNATMEPLPDIAGAVSAAAGSIQMTAGAAASGLVAVLFDGRSALSMSAVIAACSLLALIGYILVARSAERRTHSKAVVASPVIEVAAGLPEKL